MPNEAINPAHSYRLDQVAVILGVHVRTVRRRIKDLESPLRAFRTGRNGRLRIQGADLIEFIENHRVDPLNE